MSREYLGDTFDIHGGGKDLIFPHHENEIAQSRGATGGDFANIWVHHGFVTIKDEKMSKSLGNFLTIRDVLARYEAETLRLFIFSTQYRNPVDFSEEAMAAAETGLRRLYACLAEIAGLPAAGPADKPGVATPAEHDRIKAMAERFHDAMDNDFNTAQALGQLFEAVKTLNRIRQALPGKPAAGDLTLLRQGAASIRALTAILGLLGEDPLCYTARKQADFLKEHGLEAATIEGLIQQRNAARGAKDWQQADALRDRLKELGIEIQDSAGATTTWKVRL